MEPKRAKMSQNVPEFSTWKMSTDQIPVDISVDSCSGSVDIWLAPSGQVSTEIQDME